MRRSIAAIRDAVLGAEWFAGTWRRNNNIGCCTTWHDQDESADKYKLLGCVDDVIDEFGGVVTNCSAHRLSVVFINDGCYLCMHVHDVIR